MKTIIMGLLMMILTCSVFNAYAQKSSKKFSLGIGMEGGSVTGDFDNLYKYCGGFTVRASFKAGPGFATLASGAIVYDPKTIDWDGEKFDLNAGLQIPIKAGYKFIFAKHLFIMGEIGYSIFDEYSPNANLDGIVQEKFNGFTYAPSAGVNLGALEAGIKYEIVSGIGESSLSNIALRIGLNF